jgi:hypothetical protein
VKTIEELLEGKVAAPVYKSEIMGRGSSLRWPRNTLYLQTAGTNFAEKRRLLGRYSSLSD